MELDSDTSLPKENPIFNLEFHARVDTHLLIYNFLSP